jgi:hypothetical protein
MKFQFFLILTFISFFLKAQTLTFRETRGCAQRKNKKEFVTKILAKNYFFLKKDSTENGTYEYYALKGDSNIALITIKSYNFVDIKFSESQKDSFKSLFKEIMLNCEASCFGHWIVSTPKKLTCSFNSYIVDKTTKIIYYSEPAHNSYSEMFHLVFITEHLNTDKGKFTKLEKKNCADWFSVCSLMKK